MDIVVKSIFYVGFVSDDICCVWENYIRGNGGINDKFYFVGIGIGFFKQFFYGFNVYY